MRKQFYTITILSSVVLGFLCLSVLLKSATAQEQKNNNSGKTYTLYVPQADSFEGKDSLDFMEMMKVIGYYWLVWNEFPFKRHS